MNVLFYMNRRPSFLRSWASRACRTCRTTHRCAKNFSSSRKHTDKNNLNNNQTSMIYYAKNISSGIVAVMLTLGAFGAGAYGAVALNQSGQAAAEFKITSVALADSALIAKSAILYDTGTGRVLYQKNAYEQVPLASLTKLMAVQTVLSVKSPDTPVQITRSDLNPSGDSGLKVGQTINLGDLIKFALVASSNDAMEAAAASLGDGSINKMNAAAAAMGLTKTHFFNATGLDISTTASGAYGSAYDVA